MKSQKEKNYDNLMNEGCEGYNPHRGVEAQPLEKFLAIWTVDTIAARRAEWNGWLTGLPKGSKVSPKMIADQERQQGWKFVDLKKAKAARGIE